MEQQNFFLINEKQELQFKVWDLEKMVHNLLEALNASESLRKNENKKGSIRI